MMCFASDRLRVQFRQQQLAAVVAMFFNGQMAQLLACSIILVRVLTVLRSQTIMDVEQAYAAAGLSAPILEAAILENVTYDVREVPIPEYVLQAFQDEDRFAGNYLPTTNYHFKQENICI